MCCSFSPQFSFGHKSHVYLWSRLIPSCPQGVQPLPHSLRRCLWASAIPVFCGYFPPSQKHSIGGDSPWQGVLGHRVLGHHVLQVRWVFPGWVPHTAGKSGSCKACNANPLYVLLWHWVYCTFIVNLLKLVKRHKVHFKKKVFHSKFHNSYYCLIAAVLYRFLNK